VKAKTDALVEASHQLAEAVYAKASAEQETASDSDGAANGDEEVVEDADYEVVEDEK
jgi:molecular chaperone DnaK